MLGQKTRMRRQIAALGMGAALFAVLMAVAPATAAPVLQVAGCTASTASLTITPSTNVTASQQLALNGSGYSPNSLITFTQDGQNVGITSVTTNASGQFTFTGTASPTAGTHTVTAADATGRCGAATYTVGGTGTTYGTGTCPAGYVQSGNQCVASGTAYGTGLCPAGYVQSGNQCVLSGTGYYGGANPCPAGWTLSSTPTYTTATTYPYTNGQYPYAGTPGYPYSGTPGYPYAGGQYPYAGGQYPYGGGQCVPIGYAGTTGASVYGAAPTTPCPAGYTYSGAACVQQATTPTTVVQQPTAVAQPAARGVAYTGSRTVQTAAIALGLLFAGLLMLSARRLATSRRAA